MTLNLKPCCCGCQAFLPPWALKGDWREETPEPDDVDGIISCSHNEVCYLYRGFVEEFEVKL